MNGWVRRIAPCPRSSQRDLLLVRVLGLDIHPRWRQVGKVGLEAGLHCIELFEQGMEVGAGLQDRKSTRLNSSHVRISYAVFCLKKKKLQFSTVLLYYL